MRDHNYESIILVTNNYHMPRSLLELGRRVDADLRPYPVVNKRLNDGRWLMEPEALRVLFTEYTKYLASIGSGLIPLSVQQGSVEMATTVTPNG